MVKKDIWYKLKGHEYSALYSAWLGFEKSWRVCQSIYLKVWKSHGPKGFRGKDKYEF